MFKKLTAFSDRFIPHKDSLGQDELGKQRVFMNSSTIAGFFALLYIGITTLIQYPIGSIGLLVAGLLFFSIPLLLRAGIGYTLLANFFIVIVHASLVLYIVTQGGIRFAVVTPYLVFVICISILFLGFGYALGWTIVTALTMIVLLVLDHYKVNMPIAYNQTYELLYRGIVWVGLLFLILIVINVFKNSEELAKEKLAEKNIELENTLQTLRKTQEQLIHTEKLASLGQMTAGIAHEIQNPLNFIKNFSEVSVEMINESEDIKSEEERQEFYESLRSNLLKIGEHSQRMDKIVKNMLDHAHIHGNERITTNINLLCSEMLEMTLKGIKRTHDDFVFEVRTEFDESEPLCKIIPQDTSRILVNLVNNSIYSLRHKKKDDPGFHPFIKVSTRRENGAVAVRIEDNGMGIPENIQKEIFKPFFTTKPTGEGTGLGLSLSSNIMQSQDGSISLEESSPDKTIFCLVFQNS